MLTWPVHEHICAKKTNTTKSNCIFCWKLREDRFCILRYLDSLIDKFFFSQNTFFPRFWLLAWDKLRSKLDKKFKLWVLLAAVKNWFYKIYQVSVKYLLGLLLVKILAQSDVYYWSYCPKNLPKFGPIGLQSKNRRNLWIQKLWIDGLIIAYERIFVDPLAQNVFY